MMTTMMTMTTTMMTTTMMTTMDTMMMTWRRLETGVCFFSRGVVDVVSTTALVSRNRGDDDDDTSR